MNHNLQFTCSRLLEGPVIAESALQSFQDVLHSIPNFHLLDRVWIDQLNAFLPRSPFFGSRCRQIADTSHRLVYVNKMCHRGISLSLLSKWCAVSFATPVPASGLVPGNAS